MKFLRQLLRQHLAARRLQRLVEANRNAPATQSYRAKRAAMIRHTRGIIYLTPETISGIYLLVMGIKPVTRKGF